MDVTKSTFFRMSGTWTDWIYGIADGQVGPGSGQIIARCFSDMSPEGERGNIDTSRIEIVTVKDFREAVIGFIKKRFSERYREEKIEALESLINEAEGWNQNL